MEIVRCANCIAPLRLDTGPIATCIYCGAQTRIDTPTEITKPSLKTGARLAATIAFATETRTIPFLDADAALPIFRTETLSTSRDNQDVLKVNLVQGETSLARFDFPIRVAAPRGVPKIALTVRVSTCGAMSLTLSEQGVSNMLDRDGINVRVLT